MRRQHLTAADERQNVLQTGNEREKQKGRTRTYRRSRRTADDGSDDLDDRDEIIDQRTLYLVHTVCVASSFLHSRRS